MSIIKYIPPVSVQDFIRSEKFVSLIVGPVGSGKTTAAIFKVLYHAARMKAQADGIRRSRCVVIRNTRGQLSDTTIPSFQTWFDTDIATFLKTDMKMMLKVGDVECELLFRGMDDQQDIRKLLSLEVSFALLDEYREIPQSIFDAVQGRVGRYPSRAKGGCVKDDGSPNHHVFGASNPPDFDTFWEQVLSLPPDNTSVHFQPSGLSAEADWLDNLIDGYYVNLQQGKTQDWIDVYINSKFGKSLSGQPVFRAFDRKQHVSPTALHHLNSHAHPLIIGFDCGLTPAATISQVDYSGRLVTYESLTSEGMGAMRFSREKLKPLLAARFPGMPSVIIGDPAGQQRVQTDERTVFDILRAEGFKVIPAKTNFISARLTAVDSYLTRTIDSKSAVLIDPAAQSLITALAGRYRYKVKNNGEVEDKPDKTHPWSDVCFVAGTNILTPDGQKPIESLRTGDTVCVHDGVDTVVATGHRVASVVRLTFSDGTTRTCTLDHPFAVKDHPCFVPADALTSEHQLVTREMGLWANGKQRIQQSEVSTACAPHVTQYLLPLLGAWHRAKENIVRGIAPALERVVMTGWRSTDFGFLEMERTIITGPNIWTKQVNRCTSIYGSVHMDGCQKDTLYITSTITPATMWLKILNSKLVENTLGTTLWSVLQQARLEGRRIWQKHRKLRKHGIAPQKEEHGIECMRTIPSLNVIQKEYLHTRNVVYNLTTERTHTYYADNVLVHNCDAYQYTCLHADAGNIFGKNHNTPVQLVQQVKWVYV
jgi:hypothetical protein